MNLSNNNEKKSRKSGIASLFGKGSVSKIGKSQFPKSMGGIMERLKGLSRKDLALVGVGLSVLVAAPVAEYMMSKPADSANMLTSGFSSRDAQGTSALASLYEPGINALSQGSADGSGEVITPLSARDPSSLILGAQPEQSPMPDYSSMMGGMGGSDTSSSSSGSSSGPSDYNDLRDTVKDAARHGAAKAVQNAGTPTVINRMGTMFRGEFGAVKTYGGSGTTGDGKKLSTPSKANVSAKQSKMVNPVSSGGFKGATNNPRSGDSSAADKLRAKADAQGGFFSGASAVKSADAANAIKMNEKVGGDSAGSGYDGTGYGKGNGWKAPSDRGATYSHKHSGECTTLACQAAKQRQQAALKWEEYLKYEWRKQLLGLGFDLGKTFISDAAKKGWALLWGEDVEGVTTYYCVAPIDPNKGNEECLKGKQAKVRVVHKSKNGKEIGSDGWKKPCVCGIYRYKTMVAEFGNINENGLIIDGSGNGQQGGNSEQGTQTDSNPAAKTFEAVVKTYDQGLQKFMGEMAKVDKDATNRNGEGVGMAIASLDTYRKSAVDVGIGHPLAEIQGTVKDEADKDQKLLTDIASNIGLIEKESGTAKTEYEEFKKVLEDVKNNPAKYLEKSSGGQAVSAKSDAELLVISSTTKMWMDMYEGKYQLQIVKNTQDMPKYRQAHDIFMQYVTNSKAQVDRIVMTEYANQAGARELDEHHNKLSAVKNVKGQDKNSSLPEIDAYLTYMTGSPSTIKQQQLSQAQQQQPAGGSGNAVGEYKPTQLVRVWRGLDANFGTKGTDTEVNMLNDKKLSKAYEEAAAKKTKDEEAAWKADCPLDLDNEYELKKDLSVGNNMTKTDFYSPAYRVVVEIPIAINEMGMDLSNRLGTIRDFAQYRLTIEQELAKLGIDIKPQTNPAKPDQENNTVTPDPDHQGQQDPPQQDPTNPNNGNPGSNTTPAVSGAVDLSEYSSMINFEPSDTKKLEEVSCKDGNYSANPKCKQMATWWNKNYLYLDSTPKMQKYEKEHRSDDPSIQTRTNATVAIHNDRHLLDDLQTSVNTLDVYIDAAERMTYPATVNGKEVTKEQGEANLEAMRKRKSELVGQIANKKLELDNPDSGQLCIANENWYNICINSDEEKSYCDSKIMGAMTSQSFRNSHREIYEQRRGSRGSSSRGFDSGDKTVNSARANGLDAETQQDQKKKSLI